MTSYPSNNESSFCVISDFLGVILKLDDSVPQHLHLPSYILYIMSSYERTH